LLTVKNQSITVAETNPAAPEWFKRAIAAPVEERCVEVDGARIHYLRWGQVGRPGLLLVHGGFAHAHWFDFIAPFFAERYLVAALDLSGMGDSGFRSKYSGDLFAKEALAVCEHAEFLPSPVIVGHSFGGYVAFKAAANYGKQLTGIVMADCPIRPPEVQQEHDSKRLPSKPKEIYPTLEAALARFRLIPAQPCENDFILDHIARHSLAKVEGGWSWKFDNRLFDGFQLGTLSEELTALHCRFAVIYGEKSALFPPEIVEYMTPLLEKRNIPLIVMPGVHHHLFLEQPLAFIKTLEGVLAQWGY
jgi:pimeloyl-ACP methyl ester carboxylesterase